MSEKKTANAWGKSGYERKLINSGKITWVSYEVISKVTCNSEALSSINKLSNNTCYSHCTDHWGKLVRGNIRSSKRKGFNRSSYNNTYPTDKSFPAYPAIVTWWASVHSSILVETYTTKKCHNKTLTFSIINLHICRNFKILYLP